MIRGLAILLGLALGLAAAALAAGRIGHLRDADLVALPGWTAGLGDDSGALSGTWRGAAAGWPVARIAWDAAGIGPDGLAYRVQAETPGGTLSGSLLVPLAARPLLTLADQDIDLAGLIAPGEGPAGGLLVLDRLEATLAVAPPRPVAVRGSGRLAGLTLLGADLGTAPLTVDPDGETGWRAEIALDGPLAGTLTVAGLYDSPALRIEGTLTETAPLPSELRAFLDRVADGGGGTWTVGAGADLRRLLARP